MNDRMRAIVEEARKLAPEERRELFDLLEAEFAVDEGDRSPEVIEAAWLEEVEQSMQTRYWPGCDSLSASYACRFRI